MRDKSNDKRISVSDMFNSAKHDSSRSLLTTASSRKGGRKGTTAGQVVKEVEIVGHWVEYVTLR